MRNPDCAGAIATLTVPIEIHAVSPGTSGDNGDTAPTMSFSASTAGDKPGTTGDKSQEPARINHTPVPPRPHLSPVVPTSDWVRGDTETRATTGVPSVPSCPRMFSASCMRVQKSSFNRRRPTCS